MHIYTRKRLACAATFPGNAGPVRQRSGPQSQGTRSRKHAALLACPTHRLDCCDRGSHGVSDPSGRARGQCERAPPGSPHAMSPSTAVTPTPAAGGRARRPIGERSAAKSLRANGIVSVVECTRCDARLSHRETRASVIGDDLISRGRPRGRPQLFVFTRRHRRGERCRYWRESSTHSTRP